MAPLTAVIVVSYGSSRLLAENFATAGSPGTSPAGTAMVVVDNWSTAAERADVARLAADRGWDLVAPRDNGGFGAGVNLGVARALELGADVLVLLNPDLEIDAATVDALAETVRADPDAVVAPVTARPDGRMWHNGGTLDVATGRTRSSGAPAEPDWLSGAALAISASMWERVGGFDEDYFLYWEDVDLSRRVRRAGGRLVVRQDLSAVHDAGGTQATAGTRAKSTVYYRYMTRGRLLFAGTHLSARAAARWALGAPGYAREVVLRGGRRQLLRSPAPVLAAARGTLEGLAAGCIRQLRRRRPRGRGSSLLIAHPSPDLYGSDRQMLETVAAAVGAGRRVEVALPADGPLVPLLREHGATVTVESFPVLRKALLRPTRLPGLVGRTLVATVRLSARMRRERPDVLLVNTVTIPVWALAGRLARIPVLCHVHEAEEDQHRVLRAGLAAPLLLANHVITNSAAARRALTDVLPVLAPRITVVHNGVPGPAEPPAPAEHEAGAPWRLVLVGRLSPRKGTDVAVEAVARLVEAGRDVELAICGTTFEGYEWFEAEIADRAARPDLAGRIELLGYVHPTWPHLAAADVVLVPSRAEPFGNVAVEGMLARRPVVASRVQGLAEVLDDGRTGLLVPVGDADALAEAVGRLIDDADLRTALAERGHDEAHERFTPARYRAAVLAVIDDMG
ncbi:glycosyltransferase [Actinotalea sp. M2MS4P-6]|uniref:glycosyltransferase n=1 Tax=Actinotalea sp. M2MS4P-6 TaxID=2983762 RepID=UPI0021E5120C|nr:glycosyltransferase [Actinotalea sp. M2MS4P-6]MCV2395816.1 glycosyltransferase [Actinotalea sp. M2MS4P-6]